MINFDTEPQRYRHWRLSCDGPVATLTLDVEEEGGLAPVDVVEDDHDGTLCGPRLE